MSDLVKQNAGLKSPKAWLKLIISIPITAIIIFSQAITNGVVASTPIPPLFKTAIGEIIPLLLATIFMIVLGGRKWLGIDKNSVKYAFKVGWPYLTLGIAGSLWNIISSTRKGVPLAQGVLVNFIAVILVCLLIGFFEEILYRGINLGTMLGVFGGSKVLIMFAVIFCCWTFGRVHVTSLSFDDPLLFGQSFLKIIQTGMFGITMCDIVMHTKKIGGAALLHATNDFLLMVTGALYEGKSVSGQYTVADASTGKLVIVTYLIMIAVYLYPTIRSIIRIWRDYDKCYGPFVKE